MKRSLLLLIVVFVLLSACEMKEFALPKWDVELRVPLIYQRYYVSDLADEVNIIVSDDDVLTLIANGSMDTPQIGSIPLHPSISQSGLPVISGTDQSLDLPFMDMGLEAVLFYGRVGSGSLMYQLDITEPSAEIMIELCNVRNDAGESLKIDSGTGGSWQTINLAGYHFGDESHGEELENIVVNASSTSALPAGSPIATFGIQINQPLQFSDFHGILNNYEIGMNESSTAIEIEYPQNINEAIILQEAVLLIDVANQIGFSCEFEGNFVAIGNNGSEVIPIKDNNGNNFIIDAASETGPSVTHLSIENGLNTLLQAMPTQILLEDAKFVISSESGSGKVKSTNIIEADYRIRAPFKFILQDTPITIQESVRLEISEDNQDIFSKRVVEAEMAFDLINKLPIGGCVEAYFSVNDEIDPDNPSTFDFAKCVTLLSNQASGGTSQIIPVKLEKDELRIFSNPEVFLRWRFSFEDTQGEPITIYAGEMDYIELRSMVTAKVLIGGGEEK